MDKPASSPTPFSLAGQVAVGTGAAGGIGRAIARELAHAGADIVVHGCHRRQAAESLVAEIQRLGRSAVVQLADLAEADRCHEFEQAAWKWRGRVDIWINAAGADVLTGDAAHWP